MLVGYGLPSFRITRVLGHRFNLRGSTCQVWLLTPIYQIKTWVVKERELLTQHRHPTGRGKVSSPAHLPDTDISFRFEDLNKGARVIHNY
jgi:hypothetical protein